MVTRIFKKVIFFFPEFLFTLLILFAPHALFSQMPMITDDTGTQGRGCFQAELSNGMGINNEHRCSEKITEIAPVLTYGISGKVDLVFCAPYIFQEILQDSVSNRVNGFSDISFETKYTFLKKDLISLAIKPGLSVPTGNHSYGLGSGKFSASLFIITSLNFKKLALHSNIGYLQNANRHGEAFNIWHFSCAGDYPVYDKLHVVLNTGLERNPDKAIDIPPAFGLAGLYFFITPDFEFSAGYKSGFTEPETNHAFLFGLTLRIN